MAQAKKKTATKTAKKSTCCTSKKKTCKRSGMRYEKYQRGQRPNMFFIVSMSVLAASLLFANLILINV